MVTGRGLSMAGAAKQLHAPHVENLVPFFFFPPKPLMDVSSYRKTLCCPFPPVSFRTNSARLNGIDNVLFPPAFIEL